MGNALSAEVASRLFLSGNDAVAHAVRDAAVRVAAAYPGTPSTEILEPGSFTKDPRRWVMVPGNAKPRLPLMFEREAALAAEAEASPLNRLEVGSDRRIGFVISGPAYMHVRDAFPDAPALPPQQAFPRPPTMCVACSHLGIYYILSQLRNLIISGDIGCYTLGAGHPWNALDTCISMGASMGMALGMDKGRGAADQNKKIVAVIGDSTFMHMGMQGLLDITYNRGNVTILLLDNRAVGMTGGQDNPATGRDIHGIEAPRVDFPRICEALGVKKERIRVVDPYQLPVLFKALREETKIEEPSVIITDRPCVLIDDYKKTPPYAVTEDKCTGCGNCLDVGCPAIHVTRRGKEVKASGKEVDLAFVRIETSACTGCGLCVQPCAPEAIAHSVPVVPVRFMQRSGGPA